MPTLGLPAGATVRMGITTFPGRTASPLSRRPPGTAAGRSRAYPTPETTVRAAAGYRGKSLVRPSAEDPGAGDHLERRRAFPPRCSAARSTSRTACGPGKGAERDEQVPADHEHRGTSSRGPHQAAHRHAEDDDRREQQQLVGERVEYDHNTVFQSCIRAIIPSNASLTAAATNAANASHRNASSPSPGNAAAARQGISTIRMAGVIRFGEVQHPASIAPSSRPALYTCEHVADPVHSPVPEYLHPQHGPRAPLTLPLLDLAPGVAERGGPVEDRPSGASRGRRRSSRTAPNWNVSPTMARGEEPARRSKSVRIAQGRVSGTTSVPPLPPPRRVSPS